MSHCVRRSREAWKEIIGLKYTHQMSLLRSQSRRIDLRTCASVPCFLNLRAAIHNILKLATHSCSKKDSRKVSPWKNIRIISPKHKKIPPGSSRERVECIFRMCTSSRCSCLWRIHCSRFAAKTISSAHLVFFSSVSHLARKFHQIDSRYALLWCDNLSA